MRRTHRLLAALTFFLTLSPALHAAAPITVERNNTSFQYLKLIENFAGWAEKHWNEKQQCYDAQGAGVSWSRGNGDVCLVHALLLTEQPERSHFSPRKIPRGVMLDHVRRTIRTLCLSNRNCTHAEKIRPATWGGPDWQAALETSRWLWAAYLLRNQLDDDTKALVREVATAEAEASKKPIPTGQPGNTAGDDCVWNTSLLGMAAAFYDDDSRAASWDEWCKRWALNAEGRDADRHSRQLVDGRPLADWLVATNVYPDFTLENHGFWSVPYQAECEEFSTAALAYHVRGKKIPEALTLHAKQDGDILQWLTLVDSDLLCPEGQDWAPRDIQHLWAFAWLATAHDFAWARAAERRGLDVVARRQAAYNDGALHALDFGYETDLAVNWCFSYLLHKHFGKPDEVGKCAELLGSHIFPYVKAAVCRTRPLISSVAWHSNRPAVMVVPNDAAALGECPSFTSYNPSSGLGWIKLKGHARPRNFRVAKPSQIQQEDSVLSVSFGRQIPGVVSQQIAYCALATGEVLVFSQWRAIGAVDVLEVADHPFYWVEVPGFLPRRSVSARGKGVWSIDGRLHMQVIGGAGGKKQTAGFVGSVRDQPWSAKTGEVLQDSVCVYQAERPGHSPILATGTPKRVSLADWTVERTEDGKLSVTKSAGAAKDEAK
jgi:hypothetical protein